MRAPPPVELRGALAPAWRGALSLLVGSAGAVALAWAWPRLLGERASLESTHWLAAPQAQAGLAVCAGLLAAFGCWRSLRAAAVSERTLRWDGQDWSLCSDHPARQERGGAVALMLDLGPWLLLRFTPRYATDGRAAWLALAMPADRARWAALRAAVWNWRVDAGGRP